MAKAEAKIYRKKIPCDDRKESFFILIITPPLSGYISHEGIKNDQAA